MITQAIEIENEFSEVHMKFEDIIRWLSSDESQKLTHSEIESQLHKDGMELLRLLLQMHLDGRGLGDVGDFLKSEDGIIRTHKRETCRKLKSIFGLVEVNRQSYSARGANSIHPKDAQLNLSCDIHSHTVRKIAAKEASRGSFDEVITAIDEYTGIHIAKRQVEELVQKAAVDFDAFYETRSISSSQSSKPILVLTTDSKGIVVRKDDLRDATRKAAEKGEKKLQKRLSKGEKRNRKRMSTVASVYTIAPFVREPEQIVKELGAVREIFQEQRPKPESKRVWASIEKPKEEVIEEIFKEAEKRDACRQKQTVAVVDGDEKQMELLRDKARKYSFNMQLILDIIHPLEYLWKAAYVFHQEASRKAEQWVSERLLSILRGKTRDVAAGIRRMATIRAISKDKRIAADKCSDYLLKYQNMMRYDQYLESGFPIASGVIEGACRYLVKDRMDRTGARWSLKGAEAVLQMRALVASEDFELYWSFHTKQEYNRNYDSVLRETVEQYEKVDGHNEQSHLRVVK